MSIVEATFIGEEPKSKVGAIMGVSVLRESSTWSIPDDCWVMVAGRSMESQVAGSLGSKKVSGGFFEFLSSSDEDSGLGS